MHFWSVQAGNIDDLFGELWIIADLEGLEAVRFQICGIPDLANLPCRDSGSFGHEAHGTHQDRLVKELVFFGITKMAQANRHLRERYLPAFNAEFMEPVAEPGSCFRFLVCCCQILKDEPGRP